MKVLNRNREEAEEKALLYLQKLVWLSLRKRAVHNFLGGQKTAGCNCKSFMYGTTGTFI